MTSHPFTVGQMVHADDTLQRDYVPGPTHLGRKEWRYCGSHWPGAPWARQPITGVVVGIRTLVDGPVDYSGDSITFRGDTRRRAVQIVDALNHAPRLAWIEDVTQAGAS